MINHPNSVSGTSLKDMMDTTIPDNLVAQEEEWEFQLDLLGTEASIEELRGHLSRAPNPEAAAAQFLMGYLASYEKHVQH